MFNANKVMDEFMGLVGWDKDPNPAETSNAIGDLTVSDSGLKFNHVHPLLTHQNLRSIADRFDLYTYSAWSAISTYSIGDWVTSAGKYYISLVNSNLNQSVSDATKWRETNPYNEWLRNRTRSGFVNTINDWFALKVQMKTAHNLLARNWVLNPPGYQYQAYTPQKRYLGWRIVPTPLIDIVVKIERISLQLLESVNIDLLLFKNGASTPIETFSIVGNGSKDQIEISPAYELERGNYYYLAFDSDLVSDKVINSILNMEKGAWPSSVFPDTRPFAEVSSFEHDTIGDDDWKDIRNYSNTNNFGLNISLSAKTDYTGLLVDQKSIFAPACQKRVGIDLLRELAYNANARINRNEENVPRETVLYELDGNVEMNKFSLRRDYENILAGITFDFSELSRYSLPERRDKIHMRAT